jgi:hypothetical protein
VILPQSWGRLGVAAVGSLVQAEEDAEGHFAGGPAVGVVIPVSTKLNVSLFNQIRDGLPADLVGDGIAVRVTFIG